MFEIKAAFRRKDTEINITNCVVEKVIRLSGAEFDRFSRGLMREWDFLRDNAPDAVVDKEGRHHCLLVVGDERRDGILVNPEGGSYARYSAFIPNAEDILTVGQSPALDKLNRRLTDIVDHIALPPDKTGERYVVDLQDVETKFGIDLLYNGALMNTVMDMLGERPGIKDFELDKNDFIIYRDAGGLKHPAANSRAHDIPSVMEQIKTARQAPADPKSGGAQNQKKNKGAPEL